MERLEQIEARVDEIAEILAADRNNAPLKLEMTRLLADHEVLINRMIHS